MLLFRSRPPQFCSPSGDQRDPELVKERGRARAENEGSQASFLEEGTLKLGFEGCIGV